MIPLSRPNWEDGLARIRSVRRAMVAEDFRRRETITCGSLALALGIEVPTSCSIVPEIQVKASRNGPRNFLSEDQSVTANTTWENDPSKSSSKARRKSMAVRWGSFP